jgi:hypothetical protein
MEYLSEPSVQAGGAYFLGLSVFYGAISALVVPSNFASLKGLSAKDLVGVHTRVLCTVHCLISSIGAANVLLPYFIGFPYVFKVTPTDPVTGGLEFGGIQFGAPMLVAFEAAELVFTTILDLQWEPEPLNFLHHIAGLAAEISALYLGTGYQYLMWVHIAQFTQPFLYASWICHKLKKTSGIFFPVMSMLTLFFWFVLRVCGCGPTVLYSIVQSRDLFASNAQFYILMTSTCIFVCLNTYWFKLLLSKAISVLGGGGKKKSK